MQTFTIPAAVIEAAAPLIAAMALNDACDRIADHGRATGDMQNARAYERAARGD